MDTAIAADEDLFGKVVGDLQSSIVIGESAIGGTLNYVTGYTGFSGDEELQEGNYIALHATAVDGSTITAQVIGGEFDAVTLDESGIVVMRVEDNTKTIRFTATKGSVVETKNYSLLGVTFEEDGS